MSASYGVRNYSGAAVQTTITSGITNASATIAVADGSSYPATNFFCVIDEGTSLEEKVFVGSRSGNTFSSVTRGEDGPAAQAHATGATIRHCLVAQDATEWNAYTATQTTKGDLVGRGATPGPVRVPTISDGRLLVSRGGAGPGIAWEATPAELLAALDPRYLSGLIGGRGVVLTDASRSVPTTTVTDIGWSVEVSDPDGWVSGGSATLTVPAGKAGRYVVSYSGILSGSPGTTPSGATCLINGVSAYVVTPNTQAFLAGYVLNFVRTLSVGDTLRFQVYQTLGSTLTITSRLEIA